MRVDTSLLVASQYVSARPARTPSILPALRRHAAAAGAGSGDTVPVCGACMVVLSCLGYMRPHACMGRDGEAVNPHM